MKMIFAIITALAASLTSAAAAEKMPADLIAQWCHVGDGAYVAAERFCAKSRDVVFIVNAIGFHVRLKGEPLYLCVPLKVKVIDIPAHTWPHRGGWRVIADCGPNDNSGPVRRLGFSFTDIPNDGRMSISFGGPTD